MPVYPTNLLFHNVHEMPGLSDDDLASLTQGRYTAGVWVWELARLPERWRGQPDRLDKIWVPSRHAKASIASATTRPVQVIPCPAAMDRELSRLRAQMAALAAHSAATAQDEAHEGREGRAPEPSDSAR